MTGPDATSPIPTFAPPAAADSVVLATPNRRKFRRSWFSELWRWGVVLAVTVAVAVGLLAFSLIAAIYVQARSDEARPVDAIVILGTAQYNGVPSPDLQARLDEALIAYQAGYAPFIVVTGGKMEGDAYTEAESSRNYLMDRGVPDSAFLTEDQGRSSWQSMQGAAAVLEEAGLHRVLIVSDGFHLFRLKLMARELGLSPVAVAASDSPIKRNSLNEFEYVVREAAATLAFIIKD
jgi:uncharacterized SAM-binding protein YcdF (DUF218 family)